MLVIFDVPACDLEEADRDSIEEFFSELLRSSLKGLHFVVIGRATCSWALENLQLGRREEAQLRSIKQRYTQDASLKEKSFCSLSIVVGELPLMEDERHKYVAGHIEITSGNYLSEASLLVEHFENDGDFFSHVLGEVKRGHPIKFFRLSAKNGGGSAIVSRFRREIDEKRIVVCICDSDKYAPLDSLSAVFRSLMYQSNLQTFIGDVCATVCRETENHIPFDIIRKCDLCRNYTDFSTIERLLECQEVRGASDCLWLFFDIKKGLDGDQILSLDLSQETVGWIEQKFVEDGQDLRALKLEGFGDAVLKQFLNSNLAKKAFHAFVRTDYWREHFGAFFIKLYWFFVAEKPRAAV